MRKELNQFLVEYILALTVASSVFIILMVANSLNSEITAISDWKIEINQKHAVEAKLSDKVGIVAVASWYDYNLNGIAWSKDHNTCASRTLKRYSMARVVNLANGKIVDCYVNDWVANPKVEIDLSSHAFAEIADLKLGLVKVKIIQL